MGMLKNYGTYFRINSSDKMKNRFLLFVLLVFSNTIAQQLTCSAFVISDENILLAKNLDYELGNGLVLFNPKDKIKKSLYDEGFENIWKSKFNSITFNHFGINQPLGGMNETGLVIEELSTWPTEYPTNGIMNLTEFEWIQYQLDNYSTVKEVILNIANVAISKFYFSLHYIIVDSTGDKAILEFIKGEAKLYKDESLPLPILTNNNYLELIKYVKLVPKSHHNKLDVNNSQDRFLKIRQLLKNGINEDNFEGCLTAMEVLDSVKVPDTQWSIVYDVVNKNIYFKTKLNEDLQVLSFSKSDLLNDTYYYLSLNSSIQNEFIKFTTSSNSEYLNKLEKDIINYNGNKKSELVNKINLYLK